jgi:hypothetical protein
VGHTHHLSRHDAETPIDWFTGQMALDLELGHNAAAARTRRVLRRLVEWATSEGLALQREIILDPDTVERFAEVALVNDRSRATYRAELRRVGPLLTTKAPWEPRPTTMARRQVAMPYTADEVAQLRTDAHEQPTPNRRRAAHAFLALGLGCGLDGRWVTKVEVADVSRVADGSALTVQVGEPSARHVVVLADWEATIEELSATANDEYLVGGRSTSRTRAGNLAASLVVPTGHPRLSSARLRSTWLLGHLERGTRLPELCQAAGLEGVTVLSDLLAQVTPLAEITATAMLRGAMA